MILDIVFDLSAQVAPETRDSLGQVAKGGFSQVSNELRLGGPIFGYPRLEFMALFVKVVLDKLR